MKYAQTKSIGLLPLVSPLPSPWLCLSWIAAFYLDRSSPTRNN